MIRLPALLASAWLLAGGTLLAQPAPATVPAQAEAVAPASLVGDTSGVSITVSDLDRSVRFFTDVLDARLEARGARSGEAFERFTGLFGAVAETARLTIGAQRIELVAYRTPAGRPIPADARSHDRTFQHIAIVVADMDRAFARVRDAGVRFASSGPQTLPAWNPQAGGIRAFYFKDPDGHALELIWFPPGKGEPRWQQPGDRLFLGIDHTAIVVADTDRSLTFYRDLLGLRVAGGSENYGREQEHLNGVFGAHLRITTLRAPSGGPGVELLEYLAPSTGRDAPPDATPADLWHWSTVLRVAAPPDAARLRAARVPSVSAGPSGPGEVRPALLVRDPDGHAICLTTSPWPFEAETPPPPPLRPANP